MCSTPENNPNYFSNKICVWCIPWGLGIKCSSCVIFTMIRVKTTRLAWWCYLVMPWKSADPQFTNPHTDSPFSPADNKAIDHKENCNSGFWLDHKLLSIGTWIPPSHKPLMDAKWTGLFTNSTPHIILCWTSELYVIFKINLTTFKKYNNNI